MNETFLAMDPVLYDAIYVVSGKFGNNAKFRSDIVYFINEIFKHYKSIGIATTGKTFFDASNTGIGPGIVIATQDINFSKSFINAVAMQRFWKCKIY